jgi:hypothetical protein
VTDQTSYCLATKLHPRAAQRRSSFSRNPPEGGIRPTREVPLSNATYKKLFGYTFNQGAGGKPWRRGIVQVEHRPSALVLIALNHSLRIIQRK